MVNIISKQYFRQNVELASYWVLRSRQLHKVIPGRSKCWESSKHILTSYKPVVCICAIGNCLTFCVSECFRCPKQGCVASPLLFLSADSRTCKWDHRKCTPRPYFKWFVSPTFRRWLHLTCINGTWAPRSTEHIVSSYKKKKKERKKERFRFGVNFGKLKDDGV